MAGIISYGSYIPYHRIKRKEIAVVYDKKPMNGEKAVAYYDEDSITMAVAASLDAMAGKENWALDSIFFASTTPPYQEKQCATQIAAVLNAKTNLRTADFGGSLRAGSSAIWAAMQATQNGRIALAAIADCRLGAADGQFENDLGDGAAAFVFGDSDVIAEVKAFRCISKDFNDIWRAHGDNYVRYWDYRYSLNQLYIPYMTAAINGVLEDTGTTISDISKVALYAHEERRAIEFAVKLGFEPKQIHQLMYNEIGNTGCASAPLTLCAILDEAKPGERVLMVTYGEGAEAVLLETTEAISSYRPKTTVRSRIDNKNNNLRYGKYMKWKDLITCEPQRRPPQERSALPDYFRNYEKNSALWGSICTKCGTPHFPAQRVCIQCRTIDQSEPYCFLGRGATVKTFTLDGLSLSLDPPNNLVVVCFEGGGKMMTFLVDCDKNDIHIGMKVKPSFRRMFEANGVQTYFWKMVPSFGEV